MYLAKFGYVTASIASFLVETRVGEERAEGEASEKMAKELDELSSLRGEVTARREAVEKLQRQIDGRG